MTTIIIIIIIIIITTTTTTTSWGTSLGREYSGANTSQSTWMVTKEPSSSEVCCGWCTTVSVLCYGRSYVGHFPLFI